MVLILVREPTPRLPTLFSTFLRSKCTAERPKVELVALAENCYMRSSIDDVLNAPASIDIRYKCLPVDTAGEHQLIDSFLVKNFNTINKK